MTQTYQTIHLVDDDPGVRRAVSFMLRTAGYLVKTYASGVEFLERGKQIEPGCILLDIRMPEIDGLTVQRRLREMHILFPVIVMTAHGDTVTAVAAMKNGAVDFIDKPFDREVLLDAVKESFIRLEDADKRHVRVEAARARLSSLSPREMDVLQGLVRGHPNKTIGYDLGISGRTVEIHRANLMSKLNVLSLSDALRIAFAAGLGEEEGAEANSPA